MPRIKTTLSVRILLVALVVYLIGMLTLIFAKFVIDARRVPPQATASGQPSEGGNKPLAASQSN